MTLISFVVPAFRVQGYLRECLDSLLDQPLRDIEVIAVDDCSPGRTAATSSPSTRPATPGCGCFCWPTNVGLGPARNPGWTEATGEYVWFLDSDDWLAPGCLPAVADRLARHRAGRAAGRLRPGALERPRHPQRPARGLPRPPGAATFRLASGRRRCACCTPPWNKLVRREFLDRPRAALRARLVRGRPVHATRCCWPPSGSACWTGSASTTGSGAPARSPGPVGDRHFEVFPTLGTGSSTPRRPAARTPADLRPAVFERMIWHYLMVLGNGDRIAAALRPRVLRRDHRRLPALPAAGRLSGAGRRGRAQAPAGRRRPVPHLPARCGIRLPGRARPPRRPAGRRGSAGRPPRAPGRPRTAAARVLPGSSCGCRWTRRSPSTPRTGTAVTPATRRRSTRRRRELAPDVRGVWVVRRDRVDTMPPGVDYVVAGTPGYYRALARARWLVNNVNFPDFVRKRPGSVHVQTHHGTPVKVMGLDQRRTRSARSGWTSPGCCAGRTGGTTASPRTRFTTQMWDRAYPADYETLEAGYPRNDRLATAAADEVARGAGRGSASRPAERVVLYAPTHREHLPGYQPPFDPERLRRRARARTAAADAQPLLPRPGQGGRPAGGRRPGARRLRRTRRVEDLYLAADVLVTDYSSVMFDYAVLDRPIVIYAPDWEAYRLARGVYFDITAEPPGAVAADLPGPAGPVPHRRGRRRRRRPRRAAVPGARSARWTTGTRPSGWSAGSFSASRAD